MTLGRLLLCLAALGHVAVTCAYLLWWERERDNLMALIPRFTLRLPRVPLVHPGQASQVIQSELRATMQEAVLLAEREVVSRTPVGATGILRGSIASEVRGTPANLRGVVATPIPYARAVEEGSRPHWAPTQPLRLWAERVLGDGRAAYAVRWAIARRGTRGRHMFRDAERAIRAPVQRLFEAALEKIRRRLGG